MRASRGARFDSIAPRSSRSDREPGPEPLRLRLPGVDTEAPPKLSKRDHLILLEGADGLANRERVAAIKKAAQATSNSPGLVARERDIVDRYTRQLAVVLAEETGVASDDVEALGAAGALMAVHRMLVDHVRKRVLAGQRGSELVDEFKSEARRAFRRLEKGLATYAVKS